MRFMFRLTVGLFAALACIAGVWLGVHRETTSPALLLYVSTRDTTDIYLTWPGRPAPHPVAATEAGEMRPAWSPVCARSLADCHFAYTTGASPDSPDAPQLVIAQLSGDPTLAWTPPGGEILSAEWSPDGTALAVVVRLEGQTDIFLVRAGDGPAFNLTAHPAYDFTPVWSPDGTQLAFVSYRGMEPNSQGKVFVASLDATKHVSGLRQITAHDTEDRLAGWSPDGVWVVFTSAVRFQEPAYEEDVFIARADGSEQRQLTTDPGRDTAPTWSPDGQWIAFEAWGNGVPDIVAMRPDGTGMRNLSRHATPDLHPVWSPDGAWLAFQNDRDPKSDIILVRPASGTQINLTGHPAADFRPVWSPDGQWIAFETMRDGNREVYAIRPDGTQAHNLSQWDGVDAAPAWSPTVAGSLRVKIIVGGAALAALLLVIEGRWQRIRSRPERHAPTGGER